MTVNEAVSKMKDVVSESMHKLDGNGFIMLVETDYMNQMFKSVEDESKAKCVTVSLVISSENVKEGDEYCMSLGAMITRKGVDEAQLYKDIEGYRKMVDEALEVLAGYEKKDEGLAYLTANANEEYEQLMAKITEDQKKNRRLAMISNIVFVVGIVLLFLVAFLR